MRNLRQPNARAHPPPGGPWVRAKATGLASHSGSLFGMFRKGYDLKAQNLEYGLCGGRINPHRCLRTSSEIHVVGEREIRILKEFGCRLSCLAPRRS